MQINHQLGRPLPPAVKNPPVQQQQCQKFTKSRRQPTEQLIFALLISAIVCLTTGCLDRRASLVSCQTAAKKGESLLESKSVNLNDILIHQSALVEQCKRLEEAKLDELRQLMAFSSELRADSQLDTRVTLKLPAVCLLLVGPPQPGAKQGPAANGQPAPMRLDLVNWIYDRDELAAALRSQNSSTTRSKREASFAENIPQDSMGLLNDYWLDLNKLDTGRAEPTQAATDENEPGSSEAQQQLERARFHEQMGRMLDDERFKAAIRQTAGNKLAPYLSPVILVPGLAGSRLQARLVARKPKVNIICSRQVGWQDVWLTLRSFLPVAIDCWIDNVRMEFDPATGFTRNAAGIESRVPNFGSVESVRHLDVKSPKVSKYYHDIIEHYEQLGYQPQRNLFAAPYDFRLAPQQINETFFEPLKQLVEFAWHNQGHELLDSLDEQAISATRLGSIPRGGRKVTLVCHSMGCTHLLIFLRRQTAAWRQSRVRKLIALSSPWGGAVKALKALLVGEQFGLPLVSEVKMRKLARTFPGVAYMMPHGEIFERPNKNQVDFGGQVLVQTPGRNFKVNELAQLLEAAGLERQWQWFTESAGLIKPLKPLPDVQVDCLHSLNIPTPEAIIFRNSSDFPDGNYELVKGDGDGTVNHQSLLVCGLWASQLPGQVHHKIVMNTNHVGILSHKSTLSHITDDVLANN